MEELLDSNKKIFTSKRTFWFTLIVSISGIIYWHINNFELMEFIFEGFNSDGVISTGIFDEFLSLTIITMTSWLNFTLFIWFCSKNKPIKFFLWSSIVILIIMIIYGAIQVQTSFYISDIVVGGEMLE